MRRFNLNAALISIIIFLIFLVILLKLPLLSPGNITYGGAVVEENEDGSFLYVIYQLIEGKPPPSEDEGLVFTIGGGISSQSGSLTCPGGPAKQITEYLVLSAGTYSGSTPPSWTPPELANSLQVNNPTNFPANKDTCETVGKILARVCPQPRNNLPNCPLPASDEAGSCAPVDSKDCKYECRKKGLGYNLHLIHTKFRTCDDGTNLE